MNHAAHITRSRSTMVRRMIDVQYAFLQHVLTTIRPHVNDFQIATVSPETDALGITLSPRAGTAPCPLCAELSHHVHSRYTRTLADLPTGGQPVVLHLHVRRFFCHNADC